MTFLKKAKKVISAGFWMAGFGNFDITIEEFAQILEYIEKEDFNSLNSLYKKLEKERL